MAINIRNIQCSTTGEVLAKYYLGESVIYDYVVITNKYVWISWLGASGNRIYMTVKDQVTGERWIDSKDNLMKENACISIDSTSGALANYIKLNGRGAGLYQGT